MTEVDAAMPEGVGGTLSIPKETETNASNDLKSKTAMKSSSSNNSNSNISTDNGDKQKLKDEPTSNAVKEKSSEAPVAMEVDGDVETEEDESQITSSSTTENGVANAVAGDDSKMSEQSSETSADNSKDSKPDKEAEENEAATEKKSSTTTTTTTINENSTNACDGVATEDKFNKEICSKSQDGLSNGENSAKNSSDTKNSLNDDDDDVDDDDNSRSSSKEKNKSNKDIEDDVAAAAAEVEGEGENEDEDEKSNDVNSHDGPLNAAESSNSKTQEKSSKEEQQELAKQSIETANEKDEPMDTVESVGAAVEKAVTPKNNGVDSKPEQKAAADNDNSTVVDLGDDTDEECILPEKESNGGGDNTSMVDPLNRSDDATTTTTNNANQTNSLGTDSDGAVVIGSDSENEMIIPTTKASKAVSQKRDTEIIDDDDDDCVVIEDDTPAPNDLSKRKIAMDANNSSDDSQPPSKRQRNVAPTNVNQITIKDARSLMPQDATTKKSTDIAGVYPINITPATAAGIASAGPPKLVPMANMQSMTPGGLNTNLLPGLTDDMFILEAPSFIVPYIYEKPPVENLKVIVKVIESKYKLTKEDLADADKADEFDMMTEQNKQEEKSGKKKKRRGGDGDESWSEESEEEEDDDDDDSGSEMRTKVLIKEASDDLTALSGAIKPAAAIVAPAAAAGSNAAASKPGQENYFESPLGKFFMDIGVGLVQEFVQSDLIRLQKRKMRKSLGKNITEFERAIAALSGNLEASKKKNDPFRFTMKRCEFCNFKSESALSMANHYETPHMNGQLYKCNFCTFEIRNATEIVYHMEAVHNIKARLIKPLPYHQCPNCGFEDNGKAKLARHQPVCAKKFRPETNLSPPADWEAPAKIPRIKPRHGLVGTATAYQAMANQAAAQKAALASIQQQQQAAQARSIQAAAIAAQNAAIKIRGRSPAMPAKGVPNNAMLRGQNQLRAPMPTNVVLPNNYQLASGQIIQQAANAMAKKTLTGQPSISITPLPRQSASPQAITSPSTSKMPPAGMKPGQSPGGNKAQFVICEICDGYIRDLEQLRNHMQWMHKVKIHPKMIYNRPPLNCQKCQFRFFTDQGLERHLLGSHGLVTSSMQEAANKGKDAGRCPVCGRMYQWKLLNHVSRDHHMTLKPAHLSYKCTVCTATFGMYKQFETHVYTAHSTVAKKAMDGKKNNTASGMGGGGGGGSSNQRNSVGSTNDSLLKPLKINDEITIIPQPASKPRITNMESHVID